MLEKFGISGMEFFVVNSLEINQKIDQTKMRGENGGYAKDSRYLVSPQLTSSPIAPE